MPTSLRTERERQPHLVTGTDSWVRSPFWIGVGVAVVAVVFALLRLAVAAHGHVSGFIVLGTLYTDASRLPHGVSVHSVSGYDGQFYYRLALDPLDWAHSAFGVRLDSVARIQRIGYPAAVWLFSAGQTSVVPTMMVVVNIVAIGVVAGLSSALAREAGRHPAWGLLMAGYWGFLWTISRDLTELVAIGFTLGALLAIRKKHDVVGALALTAAVLTRETALVLVLAIFVSRVLEPLQFRFRRRSAAPESSDSPSSVKVSSFDLTWLLPVVVFASWQIAVRLETGRFPVRASGAANVGFPFVGIAHGLAHYLPLLPSTGALLWCGEFVALVIVGGFAAFSLRSSSALLHEKVAWVGYTILAICLTSGIWKGDVGFRSLDEFFVFSCLLLVFSRVRLGVPGLITTGAWVVVAVELIRFI